MRTSLLSCLEAKESEKNRKNSNELKTNNLCRIDANLKVKVKCAPRFYKLFKSEGKREKEGNPNHPHGTTGVVKHRLTGGEQFRMFVIM